jgi:hypothetical protein
MGLLHGE